MIRIWFFLMGDFWVSLGASIEIMSERHILQRAVYDGFDFGLLFSYFDGIGTVIRQGGFQARYIAHKAHRCHRFWRFPRRILETRGQALLDALQAKAPAGVRVDVDDFSRKLAQAREHPDPALFVQDLKLTIFSLADEGVALKASGYHPGVVSLAHTLGGQFMAVMKAWKLPQMNPVQLKQRLAAALCLEERQIHHLPGHYDLIDAQFSPTKKNDSVISAAGATVPSGQARKKSGNELFLAATPMTGPATFSEDEIRAKMSFYSLIDYQQEGVVHLITQQGALLADDMGLGKSRQAIVAADIVTGGVSPVLVVCPASLVTNWAREIALVCPGASVAVQREDPTARWVVTNYERLVAVTLSADRFKVLILDEAHLIKEPQVKRTHEVFDVAARIGYRFILTGTPILNRECELYTLLRVAGHPLGQLPLQDFKRQYTGDADFRGELGRCIKTWMLRRTKDRVLRHLKGKELQVMQVNPDRMALEQYRAVLTDGKLLPLQKITRLRQVLETAKIAVIVALVEQLQTDDKALIFCEYLDTVTVLQTRLTALGLGTVTLTGKHSTRQRRMAEDEFQSNPAIRVFIGTTAAAGVGLNLTAANTVLFASLPWTPAIKDQAEDRAYRLGQCRRVSVKIPLVDGTIDSGLWDLLSAKRTRASQVLAPDEALQVMQEALASGLIGSDKNKIVLTMPSDRFHTVATAA